MKGSATKKSGSTRNAGIWRLIVALCSLAIFATGCAIPHIHAVVWEYKVVTAPIGDPLETEINKAAADGWEFVTSSGTGNTSDAYAVMKRAKK